MSPLGLVDLVHRAARTARATAELAIILFAPGLVQLALALVRRQRGGA